MTKVSQVPKVGAATAKRLAHLRIATVRDLLYNFPFRYEDFRQMVPIKQLVEGQTVTVRCRLELIANRRSFKTRKMITEALVSDETGSLRVIWFNQPFLIKALTAGEELFLSGTVKGDMLGAELIGPAYEKVGKDDGTSTARMVPVYATTEGLTQKQIRHIVKNCLEVVEKFPDWIPEEILTRYDLVPLKDALRGIHFPVDDNDLAQSTRRLKFDELLVLQLQAEISRKERTDSIAPQLAFQEKAVQGFVKRLSFALTRTQKIAAWEILKDIATPKPMNRLLSGDVGSGKTVVAALTLYNTALNGLQGVLMAPTEILASQHFESLQTLLSELPVALHTRTQHFTADHGVVTKHSKNFMNELIREGKVAVIIGTHSLITEAVDFRQLGLVIVDEQHRFGVMQRKVMKEKGKGVHFLSMTATPIPRSLALMLYGDLDVSIINELPPGRKKIITKIVEPMKRSDAYNFIRKQVQEGRQVFVVCPLIENDPTAQTEKKSVMDEYAKLSKEIFPDLRVGYLHGKMKPDEKDTIMDQFKKRELDILVATSVIEVGVNIPNATVMMIEGADRFGLAQLHQFRGRVGRSNFQSYCLLFTDNGSSKTRDRLQYFEAHNDGFALAEKDLEIRGPGELYGTQQSGLMQLRLAKLTDIEIVKIAREAGKELATKINLFPELQKTLQEVEKSIHLE